MSPFVRSFVSLALLSAPAAGQISLFELEGTTDLDRFGSSIVSCGDLDGDSVPDFAIAAPFDAGTGSVAVYSGASRQLLYRVYGTVPGRTFGHSLGVVEDVDGDALSDLVVSSGGTGALPLGRVDLLSGASGAILRTLTYAGLPSVYVFGESVGGCGDVDLDGRGDFYVRVTGFQSSRIRIYSGHTGALIREHAGGTDFGESVALVDDLNGDGRRDLAVSDERYLTTNPTVRGRVAILSPHNGVLLRQIFGDSTTRSFAEVMTCPGDIDGDGVSDLVLAIDPRNTSSPGRVWAVSVASGERLLSLESRFTGDFFGYSLAGMGDLDDDGHADFAVGAQRNFETLLGAGAAYVISGAGGRELLRWSGVEAGNRVGESVANGGDLDGDGRDDLLVGQLYSSFSGNSRGRVEGVRIVPPVHAQLDFELDDDLVTVLENGRAVGPGQRFGRLFDVSGSGPGQYGPAVFDSSPAGPNAGGPDTDLLVDRGNVLILQARPEQTVPGIFDVPDDVESGGTFVIELPAPTRLVSMELVDLEQGSAVVRLTDDGGAMRTYSVAGGYTSDGDLDPANAVRRLSLEARFTQTGHTANATFAEDPAFDPDRTIRVEVELTTSGALDGFVLAAPPPTTSALRRRIAFPAPQLPLAANYYGSQVAAAGDVDGDGRDDVLISQRVGAAPFVDLRSGSSGALLRRLSGDADSQFGDALSGGEDLDGDSIPDIVVGSWGWPDLVLRSGRIEAYSGATGALLWQVDGAAGDQLGNRVRRFDDVNGDGVADLAVGANAALGGLGRILVLDGASGATLREHPGLDPLDSFGSRFTSDADLDGDGVHDLVVPQPSAGRVRVYSGATGALVHDLAGGPGTFYFGLSVAGLDDADGDGIDALAVESFGATGDRMARVLSGAGLTVSEDFAGGRPATLDLDGDGLRDLVVEVQVPVPGSSVTARALHGVSGRSWQDLFEFVPPAGFVLNPLVAAGDVDGDGVGDALAVGRESAGGGSSVRFVEALTLASANGAPVCTGDVNSTGFRGFLRTGGSWRVADDDLRMIVSAVPPGTPVMLLSSSSYGVLGVPTQGLLPAVENLCIAGGPITRHGVLFATGSVATFALDLTALPTLEDPTGVRPATVGETRYWQAWYRDTPTFGGSHFSDAIRLTFE